MLLYHVYNRCLVSMFSTLYIDCSTPGWVASMLNYTPRQVLARVYAARGMARIASLVGKSGRKTVQQVWALQARRATLRARCATPGPRCH